MDLSNIPVATVRHDGWTPARRAQFLDRLAQDGNVLASCALVGLSREAAYRLKRRDPLFARAWAAAQAIAREASGQVLGTRAIDGVEEDVWHRGEVVGTRRRYDNRLLLAHVARLDKLAEANPAAEADAERFDELLARVAGVPLPEELESDDPALPLAREAYVEDARRSAEQIRRWVAEDAERERRMTGKKAISEEDDARWTTFEAQATAEWENAVPEARKRWDAWYGEACATVDRLLAEPLARGEADFDPGTLSGLSTSQGVGPAAQPG